MTARLTGLRGAAYSAFVLGGPFTGELDVVTDETIQKPMPVERARERLEKAVARAEAALEGFVPAVADDGALAGELAAERSENAQLREINETVSRRLDAAIDRLKTVLGD